MKALMMHVLPTLEFPMIMILADFEASPLSVRTGLPDAVCPYFFLPQQSLLCFSTIVS